MTNNLLITLLINNCGEKWGISKKRYIFTVGKIDPLKTCQHL